VVKPGNPDYPVPEVYEPHTYPQFDVAIETEPEEMGGVDAAAAYGYGRVFELFPDVSHAMLICDDFIYHPEWLVQVQYLIDRHPGARAWSVYRSGYSQNHWTVREDGDVEVNAISSIGALTREEWAGWQQNWRDYPRPNKTLDVFHPLDRPGARWVTKSSYIQNIGRRGRNSTPNNHEWSLDFVGEALSAWAKVLNPQVDSQRISACKIQSNAFPHGYAPFYEGSGEKAREILARLRAGDWEVDGRWGPVELVKNNA
jgi:hypothetical protein